MGLIKVMKMKKYIQSMMAFAAIVSFASCSSEDNTLIENESAVKVMTFTATQEGDSQSTRAAISTTDSKVINWEENDQISIFDGSTNNLFTLTEGAGEKSATFQGEAATAETYIAVYPYQSDATLSGTSVNNVTLKATQTATDNSFDKEAALMMSQGNSTTLQFKNVVGFVKVNPKFDCTRIDLKAFDNSAILAGTGTLSYNDGNPTLDLSSAPTKDYAITLVGEIKADNYYYIAVPPVTLKAGWTIKFTATDGTVYSRKGTKDITFTRSQVTNLGEFDTDGSYWYEPRGEKVTAEQEVDLGLTITIGSKNYKVIFANANLTKDGLAEDASDFGDYFAWAATEPGVTYTYSNGSFSDIIWKDGYDGGYQKANAPYYNSSTDSYNKYTDENTLEAKDDAANKILGGDWQIPTTEVWQALYDYRLTWENEGDCTDKGMKITKNDDTNPYLFLPAAGRVNETSIQHVGLGCFYWSGITQSSTLAYGLFGQFSNLWYLNVRNNYPRCYGLSVRPVRLVAVE